MTRRIYKGTLALLGSLLLIGAFLGGFFLTSAYAQGGITFDDSTLQQIFGAVGDAFRSGHYTAAGMLTIVLAAAALRKFGSSRWPALATDVGSSLLVLVGTMAATLAAHAADGGISLTCVWQAAKLAAGAAGGYSLVRRLGGAALARWGNKLPVWVRAPLSAATWLFAKPAVAAERDAKRAGEVAMRVAQPKGAGPMQFLP